MRRKWVKSIWRKTYEFNKENPNRGSAYIQNDIKAIFRRKQRTTRNQISRVKKLSSLILYWRRIKTKEYQNPFRMNIKKLSVLGDSKG